MIRWLDRRIARPGPYMTLCLTQQEFDSALKHCKVRDRPLWVNDNADATAHHLYNGEGDSVTIVCLRDWEKRSGIEVAGLLIHEAVHIWQEYCIMLGEKNPGTEQEAYAIQAISQELMAEFSRKVHNG
jgi:hypothetical protein